MPEHRIWNSQAQIRPALEELEGGGGRKAPRTEVAGNGGNGGGVCSLNSTGALSVLGTLLPGNYRELGWLWRNGAITDCCEDACNERTFPLVLVVALEQVVHPVEESISTKIGHGNGNAADGRRQWGTAGSRTAQALVLIEDFFSGPILVN